MALALQRCSRYDSHSSYFQERNSLMENYSRNRTLRTCARAFNEGSGGSGSFQVAGDNLKLWYTKFGNEIPAQFGTAPKYSLRLRRMARKVEQRVETRERVEMFVSEWVNEKINDPLVEIDPVTVREKISAEFHAAEVNEVAVSSTGTTTYTPLLPTVFPRRMNYAFGILLLMLVAVGAVIVQLRLKPSDQEPKKNVNGVLSPSLGAGRIEGPEEEEEEELKKKKNERASEADLSVFLNNVKPIPAYSTHLDNSDLPLPPSLSPKPAKAPMPQNETLKLDAIMDSVYDEIRAQENAETSVAFLETSGNGDEVGLNFNPYGEATLALDMNEVITEIEDGVLLSVKENLPLSQEWNGNLETTLGLDNNEVITEIEDGVLLSVRENLPLSQEWNGSIVATPSVVVTAELNLVDSDQTFLGTSEDEYGVINVDDRREDSTVFSEENTTMNSTLINDAEEKLNADRRKAFDRAVQAALPAATIGVGAVSVLTGVDGGLEFVGLAATASFVTYELLWAQSRARLGEEWKRVTDHHKFIKFLKDRKILIDT